MTHQKDLLELEIQSIRWDITPNDRKSASQELSFTRSTISSYLGTRNKKPIVKNNDTAAKLIAFFKERISKRNRVLS